MGVKKFESMEQECFEVAPRDTIFTPSSVLGVSYDPAVIRPQRSSRMIRNVVTCAKGLLFLLNMWVLCVVLVVVLGKWPIFETKDLSPPYDASHLVVMRELKEEDQLINQPMANKQVPKKQPVDASVMSSSNVKQMKIKQEPTSSLKAQVTHNQLDAERKDRVDTLKHWCNKLQPNLPDAALIPAVKLQQIIVDDKHKLLYCQVPGVALNDMRKIMLFLGGGLKKVKSHLEITVNDIFTKYSKSLKRLSDFSGPERKKRMQSYYKMSFVREPLERLYSSYENKMHAKWSTYFHLNFGTKIVKKYRKKPSKTSLQKGNDVTFPEFVQYVVDSEQNDEELNEHWKQYYKQCHPCIMSYDFIGKYESLNSDLDHVLKQIHVRDRFKGDLVSTNYTYPKQILTSVYKNVPESNLRKLWKMYYPDYNLFSYPFPHVLREIVKNKDFQDY